MNPPAAPEFSVIIPSRNRVALLQRAVASVWSQTFKDYEIVVLDDGSTDATPDWLASVRHDGLRVVRNEINQGVSAARNGAVAAATGEFVVFLDDDDALRTHALQQIHDLRTRCRELDFCWGGRCIHEKDAQDRTIRAVDDTWGELPCPMRGLDFLPWSLIIATSAAFGIRRSLFLQLGGFDTSFRVSEDRDLFIRLARGNYAGAAVPATTIDVYQVSASLSRGSGIFVTPAMDRRLLQKHADYIAQPAARGFHHDLLRTIYVDHLEAGERGNALRTLGELHRCGGLDWRAARLYLRHAPELRRLKRGMRYSTWRRWMNQLRGHAR